jgi:hypothetical protein
MTTTEKTCFKCNAKKPLSAFYAHAQMKDGHLNKCKECTKADARKNIMEKREYYRQYDKARASMPHRVSARKAYRKTAEGKKAVANAHKRYKSRFPGRWAAQKIVGNAIRDHKLIKQPCFICGDKAEAHHPDYSRPLDVVWLCNRHHREAHALVREEFKIAA